MLSATHSHTFEKCLHFREREWIPLEDASVPDILGEHSVKAEHHAIKRGARDLPRN